MTKIDCLVDALSPLAADLKADPALAAEMCRHLSDGLLVTPDKYMGVMNEHYARKAMSIVLEQPFDVPIPDVPSERAAALFATSGYEVRI